MKTLKTFIASIVLLLAFVARGQTPVHSVTLAWDPNPDGPGVGFVIYWGLASGSYAWSTNVGWCTNTTIGGLVEGTTYYLAATSYDTNGVESDYSNEISHTPVDNRPATPFSVAATLKPGKVIVSWSTNQISRSPVVSYVVRVGTTSGKYSWSTNVGLSTNAVFSGLAATNAYYFVVTSLSSNLESKFSAEVMVGRRPSAPVIRVTGTLQASCTGPTGPWEDVSLLTEWMGEAEENSFYRVVMNVNRVP